MIRLHSALVTCTVEVLLQAAVFLCNGVVPHIISRLL